MNWLEDSNFDWKPRATLPFWEGLSFQFATAELDIITSESILHVVSHTTPLAIRKDGSFLSFNIEALSSVTFYVKDTQVWEVALAITLAPNVLKTCGSEQVFQIFEVI